MQRNCDDGLISEDSPPQQLDSTTLSKYGIQHWEMYQFDFLTDLTTPHYPDYPHQVKLFINKSLKRLVYL